MTGTQIINIHVFNTPLTLILSFFLLNWVHYQSYKNAPDDGKVDVSDDDGVGNDNDDGGDA